MIDASAGRRHALVRAATMAVFLGLASPVGAGGCDPCSQARVTLTARNGQEFTWEPGRG